MKIKFLFRDLVLCSIIALLFLGACSNSKAENTDVKIVPNPVSVQVEDGYYLLDGKSTISSSEGLESTADFFTEQIKELTGIQLQQSNEGSWKIALKIDDQIEGAEEYKLTISSNEVLISGKTEKGVFYGTQTFLQLLPSDLGMYKWVHVPCLKIEDYPRFQWRGIHLDESRHFFGPDLVKSLIDQMARLKLNVFHWHLIDDQGFRIEIEKYPRLTEVGAWRLDNENGVWSYSVEMPKGDDAKYGGFYTQAEIREIVAYAAARQITIVPEVEMPGHATAMIWAYPELSCKGELWSIDEGERFEFSDPLCAGNEKTFEVLEDILSEVIELFPSQYIHIGGDECKKGPWGDCPKCKKRMREEDLKDLHELQSYFIKRIEKYVSSKGRTIIGWDEILEGGLAPKAAVMSWRGYAGGIAAAEMGHEVVMTPTSYCYFDYYQANPKYEPKAIGGYLPLSKVYAFDPIPKELSTEKHHLILGGQGNVWTEHIFDESHCEYMIFPRAFAMAEVLWTPKEKLDYKEFLERIIPRYKALSSMGVNFRMPNVEGLAEKAYFEKDTTIEIINPLGDSDAEIWYTLDGSDPDENATLYKNKIKISETTCLKACVFQNGVFSSVVESWFYKYDPEVNGLHCSYYEGQWRVLPDFEELTVKEEYILPGVEAKSPNGRSDHFGLRLTGYINIEESGNYEFYLSSDDGSRMLIDGKELINYDGLHGAGFRSSEIDLEKGKHSIEIEFFEYNGRGYLEAGIVGDDGEIKAFAPSDLFYR